MAFLDEKQALSSYSAVCSNGVTKRDKKSNNGTGKPFAVEKSAADRASWRRSAVARPAGPRLHRGPPPLPSENETLTFINNW